MAMVPCHTSMLQATSSKSMWTPQGWLTLIFMLSLVGTLCTKCMHTPLGEQKILHPISLGALQAIEIVCHRSMLCPGPSCAHVQKPLLRKVTPFNTAICNCISSMSHKHEQMHMRTRMLACGPKQNAPCAIWAMDACTFTPKTHECLHVVQNKGLRMPHGPL